MDDFEFELIDGRIVQQSPSGRCRDKSTGRWLSKAFAEKMRIDVKASGGQDPKQTASPRDFASQAMQLAAQEHGYSVGSFGEAWGKVIQVQAEIALDKSNAAKATAAAKLLAKATGIMEEPEGGQEDQEPWFILGRSLALEMLSFIQEEKTRRKEQR